MSNDKIVILLNKKQIYLPPDIKRIQLYTSIIVGSRPLTCLL